MPKRFCGFLALTLFVAVLAVIPARAQRGGPPVNLPDGNGKQMVQSVCSGCHSLTNITQGWGYDKKGWDELISSMVKLPDDTRDTVSTYLGENFSSKTRPPTVVVPGPLKVGIKEWVVPSLGSRPHDPLAASDGSIWWTGMWANVLGHLDPKTGEMHEFKLKTPNSGPHGLIEDKQGNIWFTANTGGYVGELDPKTGEVIKEFHMPDPNAKDPHTPMWDIHGNLWFSLENSNMVGRLNPQTGDIKLVTMPQPHTNPYGMVMTSKGVPVVLRVQHQRNRQLRPRHHGHQRVQAAGSRRSPAPHRHHQRRHDLVRGLRTRLSGASQSRLPAKSRSGLPQAGRTRSRTASSLSKTSSGTTNRRFGPIPWCALIPRLRNSSPGPSPREAASCAI